MFVFAYKR